MAKIEKIGRTINIYFEKHTLSISLNNEKTKATLKIDDFKTYEYSVRTENGKLYIYPKPKVNDLLDRWILPRDKYNLKIWIHPTNIVYNSSAIGIGLGTKSRPDIFAFAVLDNDSLQWFENALKDSVEFYKNDKSKDTTKDHMILWNEKREVDRLRKISITLSVVKNKDKKSINLMLNSKAFLYVDLYPDDIDWILMTLSLAKNNLEAM